MYFPISIERVCYLYFNDKLPLDKICNDTNYDEIVEFRS